MAQKKKWISRAFLAVILLTLISSCFLGSTFARYTSTTTGTADLTVAKWDVALTDGASAPVEDTFTVTFATLSPSQTDYTASSGASVSNSTDATQVLKIENKGDVDALVDLSMDFAATDAIEKVVGATGHTDEEVKGLFSFELTWGTTGAAVTDTNTELTDIELAAGETVYVFATVTWTTDYAGSADAGVSEDALDTWVGENVTAIHFDLSCTAVQNSEKP